jgi:hypothetical protein
MSPRAARDEFEVGPLDVAALQFGTAGKQPVYGACGRCRHSWIVAYLPMPLDRFAQVLRRATCPACGESRRLAVNEPGASPAADTVVGPSAAPVPGLTTR